MKNDQFFFGKARFGLGGGFLANIFVIVKYTHTHTLPGLWEEEEEEKPYTPADSTAQQAWGIEYMALPYAGTSTGVYVNASNPTN
jgi:hypothetical protein